MDDETILSSKINTCSNCDYFNTVNLCCFDNIKTKPNSQCHVKIYEMVPICKTDDCKLCPHLSNPCTGDRNNPVTQLKLNPHIGQWKVLNSKARHIGGNAGRQSGKTEIAPYWLFNEMVEHGDGDYLVVSSSFPLMDKKLVPTYLKFFCDYLKLATRKDDFKEAKKKLFVHGSNFEATIFFGSATNANSLESATAKAAHLDEVGQDDFTADAYDAILGRLTRSRGRILYTTTLYNHGWYKREVYDRWKAGDSDYDVINWDSVVCPGFSKAEWEDRKKKMPTWKFNMQYRGIYDLPAGMIYNTFNDNIHIIKPFPIPQSWDWNFAVDPGGVHVATGWFALNPDGRNYLVHAHLEGNMTAKEHIAKAQRFSEFSRITRSVGGAGSEGQFRSDWNDISNHTIHIREPEIKDVEVGIDKVTALLKEEKLFIFDVPGNQWIIEEFHTYSRELNDRGDPTARIAHKNEFHGMDMIRYFAVGIGNTGDYSTPYEFQHRAVPSFTNTGISSIIGERVAPPKFR